jgi:hypothetical protein
LVTLTKTINMRKLAICILAFLGMLMVPASAIAGGGAASATPGTGFTLRFGNGTDVLIPIIVAGEYQIGDDRQHGIGGELGYDIWTGFSGASLFHLGLHYNHYFNGGVESGAYVGAYANFGLRTGFNMISIGGKGGYQHFFNDWIGIFGEGRVGFNTWGGGGGGRANGGEFGVIAGAKFVFGNN